MIMMTPLFETEDVIRVKVKMSGLPVYPTCLCLLSSFPLLLLFVFLLLGFSQLEQSVGELGVLLGPLTLRG